MHGRAGTAADPLSSPVRLLDVQLALIRRCAGELRAAGVDLTAYSVASRALDLDQPQQALHADRLIPLAWSAGNGSGLETIRLYPTRIAATIPAGTVGPDDVLTLPSTADLHLRKLSALVAKDHNYNSAPDLYEAARALLDRTDRTPFVFTVADSKNESLHAGDCQPNRSAKPSRPTPATGASLAACRPGCTRSRRATRVSNVARAVRGKT
jgi:pimeloyl-ACP methyl ester carboxylesterase